MNSISKYMKQIAGSLVDLDQMSASDFAQIGTAVYNKVDAFCTSKNVAATRSGSPASFANEALSFDKFMAQAPVDALVKLVKDCGVEGENVKPCCEKILNILDRTVGRSAVEAWQIQNRAGAEVEAGIPRQDLSTFHSAATISGMGGSQEAFGVGMDLVVPDLKVNISVAIMSFHARILPRIMPQRPVNEPLVQYKKETLEAYDLADPFGKRIRQIQMYSDPKFVSTKLQLIVPRTANDTESVLAADGVVKFGVKANILKLAIDATKYGHDVVNRTDIISDRVLLGGVRVQIGTQMVDLAPALECRLSRQINSADSGDRYGDFKYRAILTNKSVDVTGAAITALASLEDDEKVILNVAVKPFLNIKFGHTDALGSVVVDAASDAAPTVTLVGYSLDARYNEANLRKSNIAIWTNTQPLAWDIPAGRNFIYDYALGQQNSEKIAANMMGTMGIAQDKDALDQIVDICDTVYDELKKSEGLGEEDAPYIGSRFVAGDKVKPTIYIDSLDFSDLNIIRDGDRSGDIKQKFMTFVTGVTGKILNESFFLQQLGGKSQVVFKCWCSIEVLSNIVGQQLYNPGIKEDVRGALGDGVEYSIVLPNNVRLDFVTTTFENQQDKIVGIVMVESPESELNFGHNWDYGVLVSHYTVSGSAAHNRLFSNMRYLIVPTNPVAFQIDIKGMDVVTDMALNGNGLRPQVTARIEGGDVAITGGTVAISSGTVTVDEITGVVKTKEQA